MGLEMGMGFWPKNQFVLLGLAKAAPAASSARVIFIASRRSNQVSLTRVMLSLLGATCLLFRKMHGRLAREC